MKTVEELQAFLGEHPVAAVYFAGTDCGVCTAMEPKVRALLATSFPKVALARVSTEEATELAAQHTIFAMPTLLVFFEGRETFRYARTFSVAQVEQDLMRPYQTFFE